VRAIGGRWVHRTDTASYLVHAAFSLARLRYDRDAGTAIEKILRHLKLWDPPERPPPPRCSRTLEPDADFLAWEATVRLFDGID
jgi:hypothetical protein